jgi:hypothetical protein
MIYHYWIKHEGQPEHRGYAIAPNGETANQMAMDRFPGWAANSYVGGKLVSPAKPKQKLAVGPTDLSWVHPMFGSL